MIVVDKYGQSIQVDISPPDPWGDIVLEFEIDGIHKHISIAPCSESEIRHIVLEEANYIRDSLRNTSKGLTKGP